MIRLLLFLLAIADACCATLFVRAYLNGYFGVHRITESRFTNNTKGMDHEYDDDQQPGQLRVVSRGDRR